MSNDLSILALFGLWTLVVTLASAGTALTALNIPSRYSPANRPSLLCILSNRIARTQIRSRHAFILFTPAAVAVGKTAPMGPASVLGTKLFLYSRIAYVPLYVYGTPYLRITTWLAVCCTIAWFCTMAA
jgi:uncharacterized MAPEG superfamily protein